MSRGGGLGDQQRFGQAAVLSSQMKRLGEGERGEGGDEFQGGQGFTQQHLYIAMLNAACYCLHLCFTVFWCCILYVICIPTTGAKFLVCASIVGH